MGLEVAVIGVSLLLASSAFTVEKRAQGSGCVDLRCPAAALDYGLRNLVNEETLRTDVCVDCKQCADNGYSVCLRVKDSRAARAIGGCSCSHQLAENCQHDAIPKTHPANITMRTYTACYSDALQRPPMPLAVNENSSVLVTIEPFWLEPYWKHLPIENLTLHYEFGVKVPEHCEGDVHSTDDGVHTCTSSVAVDISDDGGDEKPATSDADDYEHSDNYDQYDDELPPEIQFDRDVFAGAKQLVAYYTAIVRRPRQLKIGASREFEIHETSASIESDHLKFDLKPELYGVSGIVNGVVGDVKSEKEGDVVSSDGVKDDGEAVSEETGATDFFDDAKSTEKAPETSEGDDKKEEQEEEEGVVKVNLEDVKPTKLKSQEKEEEAKEVESTSVAEKSDDATMKEEEEGEEGDKEMEEERKEEKEAGEEGDKEKEEERKEEEGETTTVEVVEGHEEEGDETIWFRFTNGDDFHRVRYVFLITLACFIAFIAIVLCYRRRCCCGKDTKTANGYRYSSAHQAPPATELKSMSRANSHDADDVKLFDENETLEKFRSVVRGGTTFNPSKIELGISVGMGKFGPIYRAIFNSYNGSVHDVNVYLLKNVTRLPDEALSNLTAMLKSNLSAGSHPNVLSLCGVTQSGPDVMLMWEPLHQPTLQGVLRESRCARFGTDPFNFASFLSSERLVTMAHGCCAGVEHLIKKCVYPPHVSTSNLLVAERGVVKIAGFGLAEHTALNMMSSEHMPTKFRWMPPEHFKKDAMLIMNEQTIIWSIGVVLWEIFSLGATPFANYRQSLAFVDAMRDGSATLDNIPYCGEAVCQLISSCTSHQPDARGTIKTIIKRLECISADAKTQINLSYREDFPYLPIITQLELQTE
ncbi:unnamed protein product [Caenorhabditis bovis]|uniref:Protein kinase domain-containing protein n=1 Tax=Caenorhabditis bovis TaxID=2654633 RepID=A0A8S1ESL8_9PELO|nr:unnamed protein product [Caenorhabditis bovis]